jgi:transposase
VRVVVDLAIEMEQSFLPSRTGGPMARRTFDVIDVTEILVHWHAGRSLNEVSGSLGVDRKTIRKYVAPAIVAGIVPGGPAKSEGEWQDLVREWFPELSDTRLRQVTWPAIGVHHEYIVEQLKAGVRMSTVHQRLRDERGLAASVASFRRYVAACIPEEARRSQVTVWNPQPAVAGEQAQIDYGQLGRWLDPVTGKLRTVWAFVMVLACSRHMFVRPVLRMDQRAWTECHVEAFAFFGGVPARLVPDNLKTGVDKPDLYDPKINRSYAELAEHYGCLVDPARAVKPRDKPRVAYCTSSVCSVAMSRSRRSLGVVPASLVKGRRVGAGRVVEDFSFVVIALPADNSGVVPDFDGAGGHAERAGHLAEREQPGVAKPLLAAA